MTNLPPAAEAKLHQAAMYLRRLEQIKRHAELRRSYQEGIEMCNASILELSREMRQLEELLHLEPVVFL
jgi:hypothetical protein